MKNEKKPDKTVMQRLEENPEVNIDVKTFPSGIPAHVEARRKIEEAAKVLAPDGFDRYLGCAVVFFYDKSLAMRPELSTITLCPFNAAINEVQAGIGMHQLRNKMMANFGRSPYGKSDGN